jgi:hypothetical protein
VDLEVSHSVELFPLPAAAGLQSHVAAEIAFSADAD